MAAPAPLTARPLSVGAACLLAWAGLAAIHAAIIAGLPLPNAGLRVRALHHLFDAGQLLFLGLVSALAIALWQRLAPRRRLLSILALSTCSFGLLLPVLGPDVDNFALRTAGREGAGALRVALVFALAQAVPLAHLAGSRLARPGWRWLPVLVALAAAVVNTRVLLSEYPGVHAFVAWVAAVLAGAALTGTRSPLALRRVPRRVALAVLATLALASVTVEPTNAVRVELGRLDTAILAAHVPPWRTAGDEPGDDAAIPPALARSC